VEEYAPRAYRFHFGPHVRCPRCGTVKVVKRRDRDRIDPMHYGVLTMLEWLVSFGKLYHCRFCRIQFYDRRNLSPHAPSGA